MRNFLQRKVWILLLAVIALGALTVLAISVDEISFRDAQRYSREPAAALPPIESGALQQEWVDVPVWKQVVLWSLVGILVILVGLLLSPQSRKRLFQILLRVAAAVFAIYFLVTNYPDTLQGLFDWEQRGRDAASAGADAPPMPEFQPPQVSPVLSYVVSFAFTLVLIAVLLALYRGWRRYASLNTKKPLDEIARIARTSLNDLTSGRDSSDVIINCYLRMSDVVADKRKLYREQAMTPQEFAVRLERAGLPGEAVRRLTGLFEIVRYGDRKSAPRDVTEAVSCLNAILRSCGEAL